jgi:hypothetical protein
VADEGFSPPTVESVDTCTTDPATIPPSLRQIDCLSDEPLAECLQIGAR